MLFINLMEGNLPIPWRQGPGYGMIMPIRLDLVKPLATLFGFEGYEPMKKKLWHLAGNFKSWQETWLNTMDRKTYKSWPLLPGFDGLKEIILVSRDVSKVADD